VLTNTDLYLKLPWTIESSTSEDTGRRVLRIKELPEFLVVEEEGHDTVAEFWDALRGLIDSYLEAGETPPTPAGSHVGRLLSTFQPNTIVLGRPLRDEVTAGGTEATERGFARAG
jgi:hypothetical protein